MDNFYDNQNKNKNKIPKEDLVELTERDFYPPEDNRTSHIYHYQVDFDEYAEYIYDLYESEGFYEN